MDAFESAAAPGSPCAELAKGAHSNRGASAAGGGCGLRGQCPWPESALRSSGRSSSPMFAAAAQAGVWRTELAHVVNESFERFE